MKEKTITPKYLSVDEAMKYTSLGKAKTKETAIAAGAWIEIGKRRVINIEVLDKYLEEQAK